MKRFMKLFILGTALAACRTAPAPIEDPVVTSTTKAEYQELVKACQQKPGTNSAALWQCIIEAQNRRIAALEAAPAPTRPQQPQGFPQGGAFVPAGYVPTQRLISAPTTIPQEIGDGIVIDNFQWAVNPSDTKLVACFFRNGASMPVQGPAVQAVYLDRHKTGAVEGLPYHCASSSSRVWVSNLGMEERVRIVYARPSGNMVLAGRFVYEPVVEKEYGRGWASGYRALRGDEGFPVKVW